MDLCPALLARARDRLDGRGNVRVVEADATTFRPEEPVDCVYFSYALTMIPDWRGAIANAYAMLKPGGRLGVVDFCVPMTSAIKLRALQSIESAFWKRWFAHDGVRLNPDHRAMLRQLVSAERNHRTPRARALSAGGDGSVLFVRRPKNR